MRERVLVPERMDDPTLSEREHIRALRGLRRINHWTGNARAAWLAIREVAQANDEQPLSVLDVATGAADVPTQIYRYAAAHHVRLAIDACDVSSSALSFAQESLPKQTPINFYPLDITSDPIPEQYDVVMCTTFLHHLATSDAKEALLKMRQAARRRVIIVDLERGRLNWLLVWIACHIFSRSPVVHFDGPQSVRAAFTLNEMEQFAEEVGFRQYRLQRRWPCRFVFVGDV